MKTSLERGEKPSQTENSLGRALVAFKGTYMIGSQAIKDCLEEGGQRGLRYYLSVYYHHSNLLLSEKWLPDND